jgi:hypothetical protein
MGDDEFFGTNDTSTSSRSPLSLDELKSLSRRLLIIAFTLSTRGIADWHKGTVAPSVRFTWENVREKMAQCLVAIHSREYVMFVFFSFDKMTDFSVTVHENHSFLGIVGSSVPIVYRSGDVSCRLIGPIRC